MFQRLTLYRTAKAGPVILHNSLCLLNSSQTRQLWIQSTRIVQDRAPGSQHPTPLQKATGDKKETSDRDFVHAILSASLTKRDVKGYMSRFKNAPAGKKHKEHKDPALRVAPIVNLGDLYGPAKAIAESPKYIPHPDPDLEPPDPDFEPLHLALVKIRAPQTLDDITLEGAALTLSQLARLGLRSVIVVDCDDCDDEYTPDVSEKYFHSWRNTTLDQANRVVSAIDQFHPEGAMVVDHAIEIPPNMQYNTPGLQLKGGLEIQNSKLVSGPLDDGMIPVFAPVGYTSTGAAKRVYPDDIMLALVREFVGITTKVQQEKTEEQIKELLGNPGAFGEETLIDRIIVLDPLGGLPSLDRTDKAHIFVNLEQEYGEVREQLSKLPLHDSTIPDPSSRANRYVKNLDVAQRALALLPASSSALLTTPSEAAISAHAPSLVDPNDEPGVGTRRQKNPLIHNLLTDKPMFSSSLPSSRLPLPTPPPNSPLLDVSTPATFLKKGIPLRIIPDPRKEPWKAPGPNGTSLDLLNDRRFDFERLKYLMEDSFGRPLDVDHYVNRVKGRVAGVIIAGDYEGGAILTWEDPDESAASAKPPRGPVPYLDKFAVLSRSQGGGVADIVFRAMVHQCFPKGVVWRSRQNNPVNKWYFERAAGTWKMPGDKWTVFWTTEGVIPGEVDEDAEGEWTMEDERKAGLWEDYVACCARVVPSWADHKPPD
ncbi:N-acetylglutamate synthase [Patellaria atrata CBS 101060]|uniref:Amino-acid acetyltransferase, mitochondrial n=1 Tax=Patellaria atrata CBS 101060 TaxID=1346257 RepID=A0A9P4VJJ1_9PEZI|nr:N-acetylglutamate synthase [Patellaria atrata CBS 101060]